MGKFFHIEDNNVKDWMMIKAKRPDDIIEWLFYLVDNKNNKELVGRIHKHFKRGYVALNWGDPFPFVPRPFCTRIDAAIFILDWRDYKRKQNQFKETTDEYSKINR